MSMDVPHAIAPTIVVDTSKDSFGNLPPDLLKEISDVVDPVDLLSWRRVCKDFAVHSTRAFGKAHFETRRHVFSSHALQGLIDITAHPIWGRFVHNIEIGSTILKDASWGCGSAKEYVEGDLEQFHRIVKDQMVLKDGRGIVMISKALRNLKLYGSINIGFGVWVNLSRKRKRRILSGWGSHEAFGKFEILIVSYHMWQAHMKILEILFSAATQTLVLPCRLDILNCCMTSMECSPDNLNTSFSSAGFANLKELDITLVGDEDDVCPTSSPMARFIACAMNLEILYLKDSHYSLETLNRLSSILRNSRAPLLDLVISGFNVSTSELVRVLKSRTTTIRRLTLKDIACPEWDVPVAIHLLEWVLGNMRLEYVSMSLSGISSYRFDNLLYGTFDGLDAVTAGLSEMISNLRLAESPLSAQPSG